MKRALTLLVVLFVVLGGGAALWLNEQYNDYELELRAPIPATKASLFKVVPGTSFKEVTQQLAERGWLREPRYFYWYARHKELPVAIKAGTYTIDPGMSVLDALALFVSGRETQYSFTIIEGWNFRQLRAALAASADLEQTLTELDDEQIMAQLDRADRHPEGMFLADTYLFPPGTSDLDTLRRAHLALERRLAAIWESRAADLPLSDPYEALTLASIIEKETAVPEERPLIAGVFVARLRRDMLLQTDPTVIYGLGSDFDGNLRRRDLRADTPYNTYTRKGLPPTPIAMVGESALSAAVQPLIDGSLFFVSRGNGTHYFSKTYAEHLKAVRKYQLRKRKGGSS